MKNRFPVVEDVAAITESIGLNLMLSEYTYKIIGDGADTVSYLEKDHGFDSALLNVVQPHYGQL